MPPSLRNDKYVKCIFDAALSDGTILVNIWSLLVGQSHQTAIYGSAGYIVTAPDTATQAIYDALRYRQCATV